MNRIPRTFGNQFFINTEKNGKKREFTMESSRCDTKAARTREILGESEIAWTIGSNVTPFRFLRCCFPLYFPSKFPKLPAFPICAYVYHHNHFLFHRRRFLVSLPLFRDSRNRVLPARKLPRLTALGSSSRFSLLS